MPTYSVQWAMELDAASPPDAALRARAIHLDPASLATVFDVVDAAGSVVRIDLDNCVPAPLGRAYAALCAAGIDADLVTGGDLPDVENWELTVPVVYAGCVESWYNVYYTNDGYYSVDHAGFSVTRSRDVSVDISEPTNIVAVILADAARLDTGRAIARITPRGMI